MYFTYQKNHFRVNLFTELEHEYPFITLCVFQLVLKTIELYLTHTAVKAISTKVPMAGDGRSAEAACTGTRAVTVNGH